MSRLLPCSSCARHVRMSERACPFCGAVVSLVASKRLAVALVGLSGLVCVGGCTSGAETRAKEAEKAAGAKRAPAEEAPPSEQQAAPEDRDRPQKLTGGSPLLEPEAEQKSLTEQSAPPKPMYGGARPRLDPEPPQDHQKNR